MQYNFEIPFTLELSNGEKGFDLVSNFPEMTEIILGVTVDGFRVKEQVYGPPENCHPAEEGEDRYFSRCYAVIEGKEVAISDEVGQQLFDLYQNEIENHFIDYSHFLD